MTNSSIQGIPYSVSVQGDHYVVQIDRRLVTHEGVAVLTQRQKNLAGEGVPIIHAMRSPAAPATGSPTRRRRTAQ